MKRVLCYGDSLTFGKIPGIPEEQIGRYDETEQWTGQLQTLLGDGYKVIEEGCPSRTINLDDPRPGKPGRNGKTYLWPCLLSHIPLGYLIIWLGTNDTKNFFERSAEEITKSLSSLIGLAKSLFESRKLDTKIIIVTPTKLDGTSDFCKKFYQGASEKIDRMAELYKDLAERNNYGFVDLYHALPQPKTSDGIHLTLGDQKIIANLIFKEIIKQ